MEIMRDLEERLTELMMALVTEADAMDAFRVVNSCTAVLYLGVKVNAFAAESEISVAPVPFMPILA